MFTKKFITRGSENIQGTPNCIKRPPPMSPRVAYRIIYKLKNMESAKRPRYEFTFTLKTSRVAHNHLPKEIFTRICKPFFRDSTSRSLIHFKVSQMVKINYFHKVLLGNEICLPHLITHLDIAQKDGTMMWFCMRGSQTCLVCQMTINARKLVLCQFL